MNRPAIIPTITREDRLPDEKAVWRDPPVAPETPGSLCVTVEYFGGFVEQTTVEKAAWELAERYRFGWGPQ